MIDTKQLSGLLGLAHRANKIVYGEQANLAIANKESKLLLISDTASNRTKEKLINRAKFYEKTYFIVEDEIINQSTGNALKKYLVLVDDGFSRKIIDICRER